MNISKISLPLASDSQGACRLYVSRCTLHMGHTPIRFFLALTVTIPDEQPVASHVDIDSDSMAAWICHHHPVNMSDALRLVHNTGLL